MRAGESTITGRAWSRSCCLLLGAGLLLGCATAGSADGVDPLAGGAGSAEPGLPPPAPESSLAMALAPGDVLEVQVFQDKALSSTHMVGNDGGISFPLLGKLVVRGLTPNQVADLIRTKLAEGYIRDPVVSVLLKESNSKKIFVFGQVRAPGTFPYDDNMTVVQAITLAGGFSDIADKDKTYVTRLQEGAERKYTIPISKILDGRRRNFPLRPGDIVFVPETLF